ncbi:uncharacterized protein RSE6_08789 [Rhynchosporium secalis]|uniref:Uncharacterized protein n=1 Tax=Rhynchosporium secalis TaxID=38038 RepID=A0A1E1MGA4_RHYSE|nr:uncharacterized protein RSE6_08789 [Rhynchosporium secalis]
MAFTDLIQSITGITHLLDHKEASIAQKMSWVSPRETTRMEDQAYCLLDFFDVPLPLLYGEGPNAFFLLQQEILGRMDDDTIFAWEGHGTGGLLASSSRLFQGAGDIVMNTGDPDRPPPTMSSKGLGLVLTPLSPDDFDSLAGADRLISLVLYRQTGGTAWRRERLLMRILVTDIDAVDPKRTTIVYVPQPLKYDEENIG